MPVKDELGKRMKEYYENIPKIKLMRRTPVAIRLDGKAFHTFTRGFEKPFDNVITASMQETMKYLCENVQGCVLGYTQSDEITLILIDYKKLDTSAWFDYEVQKMCSVAASMATMAFNKEFDKQQFKWLRNNCPGFWYDENCQEVDKEKHDVYRAYNTAGAKGAMFDARVFNIPKEEVANLIYWRQLDAIRNSIQMVGQANFSHKELQNKTCNQIKDMLLDRKDINWDDLPTYKKMGSCCIKKKLDNGRTHWDIDTDIPVFKDEGREYIDSLIYF